MIARFYDETENYRENFAITTMEVFLGSGILLWQAIRA